MPANGVSSERRILPDGCIDLVWRGGRLLIAGPDTGAWTSSVPPGGTVVGLRMRPGIGGTVLGVPASELRDARAEAVDVWGRAGSELAERVGEESDPLSRDSVRLSGLTPRALASRWAS